MADTSSVIYPECKVFDNGELSPQDFAVLIEHCTPVKSGILYGMSLSHPGSGEATAVKIGAGWAVVRGRLIKITESTITAPTAASATTMYVVLTVNLALSENPASIQVLSSEGSDNEDFNYNSQACSYTIGTVVVDSSGVTSCTTKSAMPMASDILSAVSWRFFTVVRTLTKGTSSYTLFKATGEASDSNNPTVCSLFGLSTLSDTDCKTKIAVNANNGDGTASGYQISAVYYDPANSQWCFKVTPTPTATGAFRINGTVAYKSS